MSEAAHASPLEKSRLVGTLQSFRTEKGIAHGFVRVEPDKLLHVAVRERGTLQGGTIVPCANGDRYEMIDPGTPIELEVALGRNGGDPFVTAWAPRTRKPRT